MSFPSEFVVEGMPVSLQSDDPDRRREFIHAVHNEARKAWEAEPVVDDFITVEITFCVDTIEQNVPDVDNIIKPILDALENLVYKNDRNVSDIICRKRFFGHSLAVHNPSPLLMRRFTDTRTSPFIHVLLTDELAGVLP